MIERIKNMNIRGILKTVGILLLCTVVIITTAEVTHAWISRKWSTVISEDNIVIEANNALAFKLSDHDLGAQDQLNLALLLGVSSFVLRPVSNASGESEDFFTLYREQEPFRFVHVTTQSYWKQAGIDNGYIEGSFFILSGNLSDSTRSRYLYLNPESILEVFDEDQKAASAIRISMTVGNPAQNPTTFLFTKEGVTRNNPDGFSYTAVNNAKTVVGENTTWVMNGCPYYEGATETRTTEFGGANVVVPLIRNPEQFPDRYGYVMTTDPNDPDNLVYYSENGVNFIDPDTCLYKFSGDSSVQITLRVWLEGEDPYCVEEIAGKRLKLIISFGSATCSSNPNDAVEIGGKLVYPVIKSYEEETTAVNP